MGKFKTDDEVIVELIDIMQCLRDSLNNFRAKKAPKVGQANYMTYLGNDAVLRGIDSRLKSVKSYFKREDEEGVAPITSTLEVTEEQADEVGPLISAPTAADLVKAANMIGEMVGVSIKEAMNPPKRDGLFEWGKKDREEEAGAATKMDLPAGKLICPVCKGKRYIEIPARVGSESDPDYVRCTRCNGTGWIVEEESAEAEEEKLPCPGCKGRGYFIWKNDDAEIRDGALPCVACQGTGELEKSVAEKYARDLAAESETELKPCVHCEAKQAVIDKLIRALNQIYEESAGSIEKGMTGEQVRWVRLRCIEAVEEAKKA